MNASVSSDDATTRAANGVAGAARFARASAWVLVVLAGLSTLVSAWHPLSAQFLISVLALGNGVVEWRFARRFGRGDSRAPGVLALNQTALGVEVLLYTAWRLYAFSPAEILVLLDHPRVQRLFEGLPREELRPIFEKVPPLFFLVIAVSGVATALGCWGVAWYYRSRQKLMKATVAS